MDTTVLLHPGRVLGASRDSAVDMREKAKLAVGSLEVHLPFGEIGCFETERDWDMALDGGEGKSSSDRGRGSGGGGG